MALIHLHLAHSIHFNLSNNLFRKVCKWDHVEMVQHVHQIYTIHAQYFNPKIITIEFYFACVRGNLDAAKGLYTIQPSLSNYVKHTFNDACERGHLEVAQWLYETSLTSDIPCVELDDYRAFRWACEMGHLHVAQWIASLRPQIYTITNIYSDPIESQIIHQLDICKDDVITRNVVKDEDEETEAEAEADECIICQQDKPDLMSDCNHTYCEDCIRQWFNHSDQETCPCCRRDIESFQRIVYSE